MPRHPKRRYLDVLIGLVAVLTPALLLLADQVVSAVPPYHHIKITPGLTGVTQPIDLAPTAERILDGEWQGGYARKIGTLTPLYPFAVRLRNQVLYSLFGLSGTPAVTVGRGGILFEQAYLDEYCSRDLTRFMAQAHDRAPKLRQLQDAFTRHGKTFLYIITPSKIGQYPGLAPQSYPCLASAADREGLLPLWRRVLDETGVRYADTTAPLLEAQGQYPFAMYPPGGTHWNAVGAAIATRTIATALDDASLPPPAFTWTMTPRPSWPDDDLASLMNLGGLSNVRNYAVPRVLLSYPASPAGCRRLSVAIVGGSFMNRPAEMLAQAPCAPRVEEWQYWTVFDITWPSPEFNMTTHPVAAAARDAKLLAADIVLLEENEERVARSNHAPALYDLIGQTWGFAPEGRP